MKTVARMKPARLLVLCVALASRAAAIAADPDSRFEQLDANDDGRLDAAEAGSLGFFRPADTDGDGLLTRAEARTFAQRLSSPKPAGRTASMQGDGDAAVFHWPVPPIVIPDSECPVRMIEAKAADGRPARGWWRRPKSDGPHPAIVFIHGGLTEFPEASLRRHLTANPVVTRFLAAGYAVVMATFRSYGQDVQARGPVDDVRAVVHATALLPGVDPRRIALYGGSGGGSIAMDLGGDQDVRAVVAGEPATVLYTGMLTTGEYGPRLEMMASPERFFTADLRERTLKKLATLRAPVLILHGDQHDLRKLNKPIIVPLMKEAGVQVEYREYPGYGHGFYFGGGDDRWGKGADERVVEDVVRDVCGFLDAAMPAATGRSERRFDTNGDGQLDDEEWRGAREAVRQRQSRRGATTPSGKPETVGDRIVTEMEYASSDGRKIPCVLSMPQGEGPFPVLVTIHGGQGNRDLAYLRTMAAPSDLCPTVTAFNAQPWVILAISFRAGNGALFGMEHDDVIAGIRFAKTLPRVDPGRVGVVGGSHGGHLALVAAEKMGREFLCVAAGSPWMTDPVVYMTGDPAQPPLADVPVGPRQELVRIGRKLFDGLQRGRGMSEQQARDFLARQSIEAQAGAIEIPTLFLTSRGDDQAPHALIEPMIRKMQAAGKDVEVYTAEKSPHGFYWARTVGAARALRGEKTPEEAREEEEARRKMIEFFTRQFARDDAAPGSATSAANGGDGPSRESSGSPARRDGRIRPTRDQAESMRRIRARVADMPVPQGLERRTIRVGDLDREYFIHLPAGPAGRPAPVVFALHGGAANSGLQMHLKVDYTRLADKEGFVVVYPSGVAGWNIGSHDAYSVQRRTSDADDLGFFRAMFDALVEEGVADAKRIYVTGGSNGGVMTQYLACAMPERIAGIGVVVATLPKAAERDWPKPTVPVPAVVMLGTKDGLKPWDGSRDQLSATETITFWRRVNGCNGDPVQQHLPDRDPADGCRVTVESWSGKAPVAFYTLEGHGHGWPMQREKADLGTGLKTRDVSAPEEFWRFFRDKAR